MAGKPSESRLKDVKHFKVVTVCRAALLSGTSMCYKNKFLISLEVLVFYEQVQVYCSYIHNKGIHIHLTMFNQYFAFNVWFAVLLIGIKLYPLIFCNGKGAV